MSALKIAARMRHRIETAEDDRQLADRYRSDAKSASPDEARWLLGRARIADLDAEHNEKIARLYERMAAGDTL